MKPDEVTRVRRAVELFSGIGGFRLASDSVGIETIWANDIDAKACAVYADRFGPEQIVCGDIRTLQSKVPPHDVLTAGFPCQPFSSAGKKEGLRDPRGTLFEVIVDVVSRHHPRLFILENVKRLLHMERGAHFATILDALSALDYRIEWRLLNAAFFGLAQNRERVFIIGVRRTSEYASTSSTGIKARLASAADFEQASGRECRLLSHRSAWKPIASHGDRFPNWGVAEDGHFAGTHLDAFAEACPTPRLESVLETVVKSQFDFTESTVERLAKSEPVNRFIAGVEILSNQGGGARMGYTVFGTRGLAPTLTATTSRHYERYKVGHRFRRLTNVEYARLQGFPDDHCRLASVYDQYALFGNAVPPPMAKWVLQQSLSEGKGATAAPKQRTLEFYERAVQGRAT